MANADQLDKLRQGVDAWNAWRQLHPEVRIDLSKAQLEGADLRGVNLSGADLSRAFLFKANLNDANLDGACAVWANLAEAQLSSATCRHADFTNARLNFAKATSVDFRGASLIAELERVDLTGSNLSRADLSGAVANPEACGGAILRNVLLTRAKLCRAYLPGIDLRGSTLLEADLTDACLGNADLSDTNLRGVNLRGTALCGARLDGALIDEALIARSNLLGASGLDGCHPKVPPVIDMQTIVESWPLPRSFLEGCGLSEARVRALGEVLPRVFEKERACLVYDRGDEDFAIRLRNALLREAIHCRLCPDCVLPDHRTRLGWKCLQVVIVVLSQRSFSASWFPKGLSHPHRTASSLGPYLLRICDWDAIPGSFAGFKGAPVRDFTEWRTNPEGCEWALQKLVNDVKAKWNW